MSLLLACVAVETAVADGLRVESDLADGWRSVCTPEGTNAVPLVLENVRIPHNWDGYYGVRWQGHGNLHGTAVYERTFAYRPEAGRRAYLVFEGVGMYLSVEVNGVAICRHLPAGKVVTTLDVTHALARDGRNSLRVTCEHPSEITDLPWVCNACSDSYCEGPEPTGLCRMVRLVTTDEVRIAPFGVFVWGREPFAVANVEVEITNASPKKATREVRVRCAGLNVAANERVSLPPGEGRTVKLLCPMRNVRRWSAEEPNLYRFDVSLSDGEKVTDSDFVETGFRTVSWPFLRDDGDPRFYVNGKAVFIHGVCETDHRFGAGQCFEPEEIDARARLVKETLGFNAIRDGHEPHDLRWGRNWDRMGVYWWPQFGTHCYFDNEAFRANYRRLFRQWMRERRNSPSVVLWGIQNESILDVGFAREMTAFVHAYDPSSSTLDRLTTCCNYGFGADWTVVQNWSGTYGGDLERYAEELSGDQLLNGEYGAYRHLGFREKLPAKFDPKGKWSEDRAAYILYRKLIQATQVRSKVCGHFQWLLFTHEDPGHVGFIDDGYRRLDKAGPLNNKGLLTLWGAPTVAFYLYRAYGDARKRGRLDEAAKWPLDEMIARGRELEKPRTDVPAVSLAGEAGRTYLYRLNCGGDAAVDASGGKWLADSTAFTESWSMDPAFRADGLSPALCSQGTIAEGVANAAKGDDAILSSYRYGRDKLKFSFRVAPRSRYRIDAWFVEPGGYGRMFDVAVNGRTVETKFDLPAQVGNRSGIRRSWDVESDATGCLVVSFPRVSVSQVVISALAVSAETGSAAARFTPVAATGYPAEAGLSWRELAAQTVDRMPADEIPTYVPPSRELITPITLPRGWNMSEFRLPKSNRYAIRFTVKRVTRPYKFWWLLFDSQKRLIAQDGFQLHRTSEPYVRDVPVDTFVNAGGYLVFADSPDGIDVVATGMKEIR